MTTLDDYLLRFGEGGCVTLVGPVLSSVVSGLVEPVVWVDGGADWRGDFSAGFAVGDGDSCGGELDQYLDINKDFSDLGYVLRRLPGGFDEVILRGFLGGRRDHEWFNLGEAHHFLKAATVPKVVRFVSGLTAYSAGEWRFSADDLFSLAALESATVRLSGACQFPISTPTKITAFSSFGLSNIGFGEIVLHTDAPVFVFQPGAQHAPESPPQTP